MKLSSFLVPFSIMILLTGFGRQTGSDDKRPAPGSKRVITREIEYYSGNIEGSASMATWPVAKFTVDENAVKYSVKEMKTGKQYSWERNAETHCAYHVFPGSGDIKNGEYYIGLGRTWSAETTTVDPGWEAGYSNSYGADNKVEIVFYY